jgi:hypothetical protein
MKAILSVCNLYYFPQFLRIISESEFILFLSRRWWLASFSARFCRLSLSSMDCITSYKRMWSRLCPKLLTYWGRGAVAGMWKPFCCVPWGTAAARCCCHHACVFTWLRSDGFVRYHVVYFNSMALFLLCERLVDCF